MDRTTPSSRAAAHAQDLKATEAELLAFSRGIDRVLRRQFATRQMRALLQPPRSGAERGRPAPAWQVSWWTVLVAASGLGWVWHIGLKQPWLAYAPVLLPLVAAWWLETWLRPRLSLAGHRFRLMRLESTDGSGLHPDAYLVAPSPDTTSGFGKVYWRRALGVEDGDIVVSISARGERGVAIIPLRTEGRLPVSVWDRELHQDNVLPPLREATHTLAHAFDEACDRYLANAAALERSRVLRSTRRDRAAVDPEIAWAGLHVPAVVRLRVQSLAAHFDAGSASATRGLLLYGPPGTGKTRVARALADSMGCAFFPLSLPDLKAGHIGQSSERVRELWDRALAEPRAVIFVDECDGVFARRGAVNTDGFVEDIVNAFLARWDGFSQRVNVWVIGATNRRDLLDAAVLSRFDEQIELGLPDRDARLQILQDELQTLGAAHVLPPNTAQFTQGLSGRELSSLARRLHREHEGPLTDAVLDAFTSRSRAQGSTATDASARWSSLVLPAETLQALQTTAGLLRDAETFAARGISVPRGLLLYGPPGTGKTQIARTLANETGLRFIAASTAELKQGFVGQSGQKVRELFERARESAPSLLFLDELDIVAGARGGDGDSFTAEIVGQLLQELDGFAAHGQHVFVLAATNRVDQVDAAVLSRFPRRMEIPLPDANARVQLLRVLLQGKPLGFVLDDAANVLAHHSEGASGRDLRSWVEQAEQRAVIRAVQAGDAASVQLQLEDFRTAS
ncbi:AAA+-type ATPase, SpoVK/Ycf46/Vps4 family [Pseudoxanthomonas sp. GM95]|uniref:AAA family ATPase n=1 Tax=Pseudoxanthomonas sp. GM95 TaxID=1881043 RepID=UPI0008B455E1|nr:AAA family ATPase [Pseudoxanthomonas sp. GM95]SEM57595.1 AAA+-type ATPase, SpoVK/Ycf46/Vps4 family [Pseudoxanthomonas sp. GM95]